MDFKANRHFHCDQPSPIFPRIALDKLLFRAQGDEDMFNRIEKIPALVFDSLVAGATVPAAAAPLHAESRDSQFLEGAYGYASDHVAARSSDGVYKSGVFL